MNKISIELLWLGSLQIITNQGVDDLIYFFRKLFVEVSPPVLNAGILYRNGLVD